MLKFGCDMYEHCSHEFGNLEVVKICLADVPRSIVIEYYHCRSHTLHRI